MVATRARLTLSLHPGAHQSQRVVAIWPQVVDSVTDDRLTRPLGSSMSLPDFSQKHLSICKRKGDRRKLARTYDHATPATHLCGTHTS